MAGASLSLVPCCGLPSSWRQSGGCPVSALLLSCSASKLLCVPCTPVVHSTCRPPSCPPGTHSPVRQTDVRSEHSVAHRLGCVMLLVGQELGDSRTFSGEPSWEPRPGGAREGCWQGAGVWRGLRNGQSWLPRGLWAGWGMWLGGRRGLGRSQEVLCGQLSPQSRGTWVTTGRCHESC